MTPKKHQLEMAKEGLEILVKNKIVYLAAQERTGKSLTAILICEEMAKIRVKNTLCLIITKKKALEGWQDTLDKYAYTQTTIFQVINYHSVHKITMCPDIVILDEAHNYISSCPKTSIFWHRVKQFTLHKPIIYISATPYAQGPQLLFNQFALSSYSPWRGFTNYYNWFKQYAQYDKKGKFKTIYLSGGRTVPDYSAVNSELVLKKINHLFVTTTRQQAGITQEPTDEIHYIKLTDSTCEIYDHLLKTKVLHFIHKDKDYSLVCDTVMKLRCALHMLEGGVLKIENEYLDLNPQEKIAYIQNTWGDKKTTVIMYHYKADKIKLEKHFKNTLLLQGTSNAEGIDLYEYDTLIIYSQDFSTARHTQRRARQTNFKREKPIIVHYLLVKKAISEQVYNTVSINKQNFVDSLFEQTTIGE